MISKYANNELLTQGLVADILSVSKETVRKWEKSGDVVPYKKTADGMPLYRWSDLQKFPEIRRMEFSNWGAECKTRPVRIFNSVELFAGAGGLALGLEQAGFGAVALNEADHNACETLRKNRPHWNIIEEDVAKIDFSRFKDIDLVSGGFPCQAFSYAGNRFGFEDIRGTLFFEFARVISETQPKVFLGENVRGLLTHDGGKTIEVIKSVIKEIGYTLVEPRVLKAIFYRVPQKRERLALVGIRNDLLEHMPAFKWPDPAQRVYTVRDALKKGVLYKTEVPSSPGVSYTKWKADIIANVPPGGYWRDLPIRMQKELLKNSFHLEGGKTGIGRRLSWDEPSLTLTCAPAQNQTGRCHPSETRPLTVREYARIQTFPDEWEFCGSTMSQYKQIGNAVPVNLAEALGRSLIALLNAIERADPHPALQAGECLTHNQYGVRTSEKFIQMMLLDPAILYLVHDHPITLLGTYRKTCRDWIVSNRFYNYPVTESELDTVKELLAVRNLILKRKGVKDLFFKVKGYSIVGKSDLLKLGYKTSKNHPAKQRYILYKLSPLSKALPCDETNAIPIVGKGVSVPQKNAASEIARKPTLRKPPKASSNKRAI